jgi:hypothetical protein
VFLAAQGSIATLLLSREPLSEGALGILNAARRKYEHRVLASPSVVPASGSLHDILSATSREALDRTARGFAFDVTPATDDRPFFFNQLPLSKPLYALAVAKDMISSDATLGGIRKGNLVATATLLILSLVSLVLVLVTIVIPLRPAVKDVGARFAAAGTAYFLLIGIGFMLIEIALLQRMSLFLGHPVYSLSVLLFSLILATGVGSLASDRWALTTRVRLGVWALLTGAYFAALPHWLPNVFLEFGSSPLFARAALCIAAIAPGAFLLGFGFPTGMRLVSAVDPRPAPWFWGVNGAAGTLASGAAVMTSIAFGIGTTLTLGALCYLLLIPVALLLVGQRDVGGRSLETHAAASSAQ